jgi:small subunit ribosomal protein S8
MTTDPIADLLTRIRNAVKAEHAKITVPHSKLKLAVLDVLKKHKFIDIR